MDRTKWALAALCAAIALAIGGPMAWAGCVNCEGGPAAGFGAPACRGPMFGTEPGCCEYSPKPSDNAWDGFCQEKLRWKQFWHKVGTGHWAQPRARAPATTWAPTRQPALHAAGSTPAPTGPVHSPAEEPGPVRLPSVDDAEPAGTEEPAVEPGPPPMPEPNDVLDLPPEPDAPVSPDQARVIWDFGR
ncbi:MAG: hypothetical protein ACOCWL_00275 [Thermoguttaceae bacterium]